MALDFRLFAGGFFDSPKVQALADKKALRVLSKFGAFVRRRAKSSIRKRKKASLPGQPPSSHVGTLKDLLFFAYDPSAKSVVVGPVPFKGKAIAPRALEKGGASVVKNKRGVRPIKVRARPFMQPALQAELPKFVHLFRG